MVVVVGVIVGVGERLRRRCWRSALGVLGVEEIPVSDEGLRVVRVRGNR